MSNTPRCANVHWYGVAGTATVEVTFAQQLEIELDAVTAERDALRIAHDAVLALINDSRGVVGLHLNGDEAPWEELRTGGRFDEWLSPFDDALRSKEES